MTSKKLLSVLNYYLHALGKICRIKKSKHMHIIPEKGRKISIFILVQLILFFGVINPFLVSVILFLDGDQKNNLL